MPPDIEEKLFALMKDPDTPGEILRLVIIFQYFINFVKEANPAHVSDIINIILQSHEETSKNLQEDECLFPQFVKILNQPTIATMKQSIANMKKESTIEIAKNAYFFAKMHKQNGLGFFRARNIMVEVAAMTANPAIHTERGAKEIANSRFDTICQILTPPSF